MKNHDIQFERNADEEEEVEIEAKKNKEKQPKVICYRRSQYIATVMQ